MQIGPKTRRRGFPGGLRAQLLLGLSLLIITTFTLLSVASLQIQRHQLEQATLEQAAQLARFFAEFDEEDALKAAENLHRSGDLAYFAIVDGTRQIQHQIPGEALASDTLPYDDPIYGRVGYSRVGEEAVIRAWSPLESPRTGAVLIAISANSAAHRIEDHKEITLLYVLVNIVFVLLFGYALFTFVIMRPIRAIGVATERAAEGDLASPIQRMPANEIGQLARSFNAMLLRLDENRHDLEERLEALQKAHGELKQTQDSLVRSEKLASVGQLAAGVAHEVGNPLAALLGYADLLRDPDTDEEMTREIVERIHPQLERIHTIIRQLLDYSRDDRDQPLEPVSLKACIDEAMGLMGTHLLARDITIEAHVPDDLPEVRAVHSGVIQILLNLFINAADAMKEQGTKDATLHLSVGPDPKNEQALLLRVSDNGPGIPAALRERIFDPFFTTKDPGHGTGLGLAISLSLMKRFGGDLILEPPGDEGGTCFTLRFLADEGVGGRIKRSPSERECASS